MQCFPKILVFFAVLLVFSPAAFAQFGGCSLSPDLTWNNQSGQWEGDVPLGETITVSNSSGDLRKVEVTDENGNELNSQIMDGESTQHDVSNDPSAIGEKITVKIYELGLGGWILLGTAVYTILPTPGG